jgi:Protein of unknown function (DUF2568)
MLICWTLQFLLELAALSAFAYWGYSTDGSVAARIVLAAAAPAVAATACALFGSPKAPFHLIGASRVLLQAAFSGSAAVALAAAGETRLAVVFALVVAAYTTLVEARGYR